MKRLRRVTEAEVIAEFLKNEFYQEEFHEDREQFEQLVLGAEITDETGNALRRALVVPPPRPHVERVALRYAMVGGADRADGSGTSHAYFPGRNGEGWQMEAFC